jgi:hypothetical protein
MKSDKTTYTVRLHKEIIHRAGISQESLLNRLCAMCNLELTPIENGRFDARSKGYLDERKLRYALQHPLIKQYITLE